MTKNIIKNNNPQSQNYNPNYTNNGDISVRNNSHQNHSNNCLSRSYSHPKIHLNSGNHHAKISHYYAHNIDQQSSVLYFENTIRYSF